MESMSFGGALNRILQNFLTPDPLLGISYISKVDLADLYMRVWVRMENALSVAFLIFKRTPSEPQLEGLPPLPYDGIRQQCPIYLHGNREGGQFVQHGHGSER